MIYSSSSHPRSRRRGHQFPLMPPNALRPTIRILQPLKHLRSSLSPHNLLTKIARVRRPARSFLRLQPIPHPSGILLLLPPRALLPLLGRGPLGIGPLLRLPLLLPRALPPFLFRRFRLLRPHVRVIQRRAYLGIFVPPAVTLAQRAARESERLPGPVGGCDEVGGTAARVLGAGIRATLEEERVYEGGGGGAGRGGCEVERSLMIGATARVDVVTEGWRRRSIIRRIASWSLVDCTFLGFVQELQQFQ
mmetsp:Transcript_30481/g.73543  ORF Transcript_30481/g.73543 Transcript_30481/m.73543 type:complete len:249 (-) Transcript_30481:749-1495(-)